VILIDDLLVWLPLRGILSVIDQIRQKVGETDASTPAQLRKRLLEVRLRYEMDEIDEEAYEQAVSEILARLRDLAGAQKGEGDSHESVE
jgi:hypothetical protein